MAVTPGGLGGVSWGGVAWEGHVEKGPESPLRAVRKTEMGSGPGEWWHPCHGLSSDQTPLGPTRVTTGFQPSPSQGTVRRVVAAAGMWLCPR